MKATLIAFTQIAPHAGGDFEPATIDWLDWPDEMTNDADLLAEFAGRACYQSWHRPNPKTEKNADYVANVISLEHFSVLEHASATFYITGVSRSLTHELIRHRHLSFSELSQRYVDMEHVEAVYPPAFDHEEGMALASVFDVAREAYRASVELLIGKGRKRKQAREAARAVMPNATETRIVVTGNHRAWRDMLKKRFAVSADAEIQELAGELLRQLRTIAPNTYQDFPDVPFGTSD